VGPISFDFDSFGGLVHPPVQGYILINRFLREGYANNNASSLHVIERVRFLPLLLFMLQD